MKITGQQAYVDLLDTVAYERFLREKGASERKIATLTVRFIPKIHHPFSFFMGAPQGCAFGNTIMLATGWIGEKNEQARRQLNAVLLHESRHILDRGTRYDAIAWATALLCILAWTACIQVLAHIAALLPPVLAVILMTAGPVGMFILYIRSVYRVLPSERRARRAMQEPVMLLRGWEHDSAL